MRDELTQYQKDLIRMWDSMREDCKGSEHCDYVSCSECPLYSEVCFDGNEISGLTSMFNAEKTVEIVTQWAKDHPIESQEQIKMDNELLRKKLYKAALNSVYGSAAIGSKHLTDMVIMSPTVQRAIRELEAFKSSKWSMLIKKVNWTTQCVELFGGYRIYFKGETEGENALRGLRANIVSIDEFLNITEKEANQNE